MNETKFINKCVEKFGHKYEYSKFTSYKDKVQIKCIEHNVLFEQLPGNHLSGRLGCFKCRAYIKNKKIENATNDFINKSIEIYGEIFDYSFVQLADIKIKLKCNKHNILFEQYINRHLKGYFGCDECKRDKKEQDRQNRYHIFITKSAQIHNNKFDYTQVKYLNKFTKVKIKCKKHNIVFNQKPITHIRGCSGCKQCNKTRLNTENYIKKAKEIHGNKYDYTLTQYNGQFKYVKIICKEHGMWITKARNHTNKKAGCPTCAHDDRKLSLKDFINKAVKIHGHSFNYDESKYINTNTKIKIKCKAKDHTFWQTPDSHLSGNGCLKCSNNISKLETKWLDGLGIPNNKNHRNVRLILDDRAYKVDGFKPEINKVYEFYGDFWHGNPNVYDPLKINPKNKKTFGTLYKDTIDRENILNQAGFNVVYIWEKDFKALNEKK